MSRLRVNEWPKERDSELLDIWESTIGYFNRISEAMHHMPIDMHFDLNKRLLNSSLATSAHIAKASKAKSEMNYQNALIDAIEAIHLTTAKIYVAYQLNYIRFNLYQEIYEKGRLLIERINSLLWTRDANQWESHQPLI